MGEEYPVDKTYREKFSVYDSVPPESSWSEIRRRLGMEPEPHDLWSKLNDLPRTHPDRIRWVVAIAAMALILFLSLVWLFSVDRKSINGSAWAGEERLCEGTAYLFRVADQVPPYDSLTSYQTVPVNEKGHYTFNNIEKGRYLLQVVPEEGSLHARNYFPSWYDQRSEKEDPALIEVDDEDIVLNVILRQK